MLGYKDNSYGYKLYNPITKKVVISRHVQFYEDQMWNSSNEGNPQQFILEEEQERKNKEEN